MLDISVFTLDASTRVIVSIQDTFAFNKISDTYQTIAAVAKIYILHTITDGKSVHEMHAHCIYQSIPSP